jgi:hypothetical protein
MLPLPIFDTSRISATKSLPLSIVSASAIPPPDELLDEELELEEELLEPVTPEDELELLDDELLELEELDEEELLELEEDPPTTGGHSSPGHQFCPTSRVCVIYAANFSASSADTDALALGIYMSMNSARESST